jgi:hypothetical protein
VKSTWEWQRTGGYVDYRMISADELYEHAEFYCRTYILNWDEFDAIERKWLRAIAAANLCRCGKLVVKQ